MDNFFSKISAAGMLGRDDRLSQNFRTKYLAAIDCRLSLDYRRCCMEDRVTTEFEAVGIPHRKMAIDEHRLNQLAAERQHVELEMLY